jgi:putative ATP-dependent endonuclease of OLD family
MTGQQIADYVAALKEKDSGHVRTFVSDYWTLEYDLAAASWTMATLMHQAVRAAVVSKTSWPTADRLADLDRLAQEEVKKWRESNVPLEKAALDIYEPLRMGRGNEPIAAQHAARLLQTTSVTDGDLPSYLVAAFTYLCSEV